MNNLFGFLNTEILNFVYSYVRRNLIPEKTLLRFATNDRFLYEARLFCQDVQIPFRTI